jgi:hypothetical protein
MQEGPELRARNHLAGPCQRDRHITAVLRAVVERITAPARAVVFWVQARPVACNDDTRWALRAAWRVHFELLRLGPIGVVGLHPPLRRESTPVAEWNLALLVEIRRNGSQGSRQSRILWADAAPPQGGATTPRASIVDEVKGA